MHTTSIHRFHHHSIVTYVYINEQTMHVCMIANSLSVCFPEAPFWSVSDVHKCSDCVYLALLAVNGKLLDCTQLAGDVIH